MPCAELVGEGLKISHWFKGQQQQLGKLIMQMQLKQQQQYEQTPVSNQPGLHRKLSQVVFFLSFTEGFSYKLAIEPYMGWHHGSGSTYNAAQSLCRYGV
jgi:hypothetical protein